MKLCRVCGIVCVRKQHRGYICRTCNTLEKRTFDNKRPIKLCRCGKGFAAKRHSYCRACLSRIERHRIRTKGGSSPLERHKEHCRQHTNKLIRKGKILIQPCLKCGAKAQIHHQNYDDAEDILWLCRTHHIEEHMRIGMVAESQADAMLAARETPDA